MAKKLTMNRKKIKSRNLRDGKMNEEFNGESRVVSSLIAGDTDVSGNPWKMNDLIIEPETNN